MTEETKEKETKVEDVVKVATPEETKNEVQKGFYLTDVPTNYQRVIALGDKFLEADALLVLMANALKDAGILKIEESK